MEPNLKYTVYAIANLFNVTCCAAFMMFSFLNHDYDKFIKDIQHPVWRIMFLVAGVVSFVGILIGMIGIKRSLRLSELDKAEREMNEEKERYKQATEDFLKATKTRVI